MFSTFEQCKTHVQINQGLWGVSKWALSNYPKFYFGENYHKKWKGSQYDNKNPRTDW